MKFALRVVFFSLLGLVASFVIPTHHLVGGAPVPQKYTISDFYGREACHSILTSCRVDSDCCDGLRCGTYEGDSLCTPTGDL